MRGRPDSCLRSLTLPVLAALPLIRTLISNVPGVSSVARLTLITPVWPFRNMYMLNLRPTGTSYTCHPQQLCNCSSRRKFLNSSCRARPTMGNVVKQMMAQLAAHLQLELGLHCQETCLALAGKRSCYYCHHYHYLVIAAAWAQRLLQ